MNYDVSTTRQDKDATISELIAHVSSISEELGALKQRLAQLELEHDSGSKIHRYDPAKNPQREF